jgi:hypothetical protein
LNYEIIIPQRKIALCGGYQIIQRRLEKPKVNGAGSTL